MKYFTEEDLSVVQKYLSNQLPEAERSAFEQRLQTDPKLQEELEQYQAMFSALEETEDQRLKSLLQAADAEEQKTAPRTVFLTRKKWAIAASFLVVVTALALLYIFNPGQQQDQIVFEPSNITSDVISVDLIRTRSASNESPDTQSIRRRSVQDALLIDSLYNSGQYQEALAVLESIPASPSILFYLANCLMALDRNEEAIPILQAVEKRTDEIYSNFAQSHLAFAYYRVGNMTQARIYALKTIENEGIQDVDRDKARILLEKLEAE